MKYDFNNCSKEDQTLEKCLEAVKKNGLSLQYVENQTDEICLAAVTENGWALQFVKDQTPEICLAAVKQNGLALEYVEKQTTEICLEAVKQNGYALEYVKEQTDELRLIAVKQIGFAPRIYNRDRVERINEEQKPAYDYRTSKMRKPIKLTEKDFIQIKNTYIYEADLKVKESDKAMLAFSLLNYENGRWTYSFYGVRGGITSLAEGKVYFSMQETINAVNTLIEEFFNTLSEEV